MNQRTPYLRFLSTASLTVLLAFVGSIGFAQDRTGVEGGRIDVIGDRSELQVVVRSSESTTLRLLQTAFTAHGAYDIVDSMQKASFGIRIDPEGSSGARLVITSGSPERTLHTESFSADTIRNAVFKAVDRAIYKTTGKPGFFAGKLTFVGEDTGSSEIYTSDVLFGNIMRLTSDNVDAVRPHWSPDGNYIVYTSYKSGFPDIHRLDLRTYRRDVIVDFTGTNTSARYSPDGSRMALIITGKTNADVWVREANGSYSNLTRSENLEAAPAWSPDGTRIVYSSGIGSSNQLYVIPSHGGSARRLATNMSGYCVEPDWNPVDPTKILFTAAVGDGYQIAVFDTQAGKSEWITRERGDAVEGQWLNDGRHIIYTHRRANDHSIKIVDTKTKKSFTLSGKKSTVAQASFLAPR